MQTTGCSQLTFTFPPEHPDYPNSSRLGEVSVALARVQRRRKCPRLVRHVSGAFGHPEDPFRPRDNRLLRHQSVASGFVHEGDTQRRSKCAKDGCDSEANGLRPICSAFAQKLRREAPPADGDKAGPGHVPSSLHRVAKLNRVMLHQCVRRIVDSRSHEPDGDGFAEHGDSRVDIEAFRGLDWNLAVDVADRERRSVLFAECLEGSKALDAECVSSSRVNFVQLPSCFW